MMRNLIYFDIDGVLNDTPARGDLGFRADPDKVELLKRLSPFGEFVCISFWRGRPDMPVIPRLKYTEAPMGEKRNSVLTHRTLLIIDDQPDYYKDLAVPIYQTVGHVGLTEIDINNIVNLLMWKPSCA
jgi:hypothetical protein